MCVFRKELFLVISSRYKYQISRKVKVLRGMKKA